MHTVTLAEPLIIRGFRLEADFPYVMNTTGAGSLLTNHTPVRCADGTLRPIYRLATVRPTFRMPFDPAADHDGETIFLFRGGGWGDILMITPLMREMLRRWPSAKLKLVTMPEYEGAILGMDDRIEHFTGFLPEQVLHASPSIAFEGVIEDNPLAREVHGIRLFARHAGLDLQSEAIHYEVFESERQWARSYMAQLRKRKIRVAVQAISSATARNYPPTLLAAVLQGLVSRGIQPIVLGRSDTVDCDIPGVVNAAEHGLSFRQSCAVMAECQAAILPDSSLQHVAGAIGVPTVALFGSFPSQLRLPLVPKATIIALEPSATCSPCHHHEMGNTKFPPGGPCNLAGFCTVLATIRPEKVVDACLYLLGESAAPKTVTT